MNTLKVQFIVVQMDGKYIAIVVDEVTEFFRWIRRILRAIRDDV